MKFILSFLVVTLFCIQTSSAQAKIAVVDVEANVNNWSEVLGLENVLGINQDSLLSIAKLWVSKWHRKCGEFMNSNVCFPPEYHEKRAYELRSEQQAILEYEQLIIDTIPSFQEELQAIIRSKILERIDSLSKTNQYNFVFQKKHILYQETDYPVDQIKIPFTQEDAQSVQIVIDELDRKLAVIYATYRQEIENDYP